MTAAPAMREAQIPTSPHDGTGDTGTAGAVPMGEFDDSRPLDAAPEDMARDERIVWQGAPTWRGFALHALHVRAVSLYFLAILAWRFGAEFMATGSVAAGTVSAAWALTLAVPVLGFLALYARMVARSTRYTVTTRRVVLRIGVALPMTVTIPVDLIETVNLRAEPDGSGDVTLGVLPDRRLSYTVLWPHARPWRFSRPEAALRSVPQAEAVAGVIASMLARQAGQAEISAEPVAEAPAARSASAQSSTAAARGSLAPAAG